MSFISRSVPISLAVLLASTGCVVLPSPWTQVQKPAAPSAGDPAELTTLGQIEEIGPEGDRRLGIVAQVLFLDSSGKPVPAEGTIAFHAYLDGTGGSANIEPQYVWKFQNADLEKGSFAHALGVGYRFWLPIGPRRPETAKVVLVTTFSGKDGKRLAGQQVLRDAPPVSRFERKQVESVKPLDPAVDAQPDGGFNPHP